MYKFGGYTTVIVWTQDDLDVCIPSTFKNNKKHYLPSLLVDPRGPCPMGSVSAAAAAISLLYKHDTSLYEENM